MKSLQTLAAVALLCGACTHLPEVGGQPLPSLEGNAPTTYRSLTDIPEAPPVTSPNMSEAAIQTLSQERGSTENAAGELRGEPFIKPNPEPHQNPFQEP